MFTIKNPCNIGVFSKRDIKHIKDNDIYPQTTLKFLITTYNSTDPFVCLQHRRIQEDLRNNHSHYAEQESWNKNNEVVHTFQNKNVKFK